MLKFLPFICQQLRRNNIFVTPSVNLEHKVFANRPVRKLKSKFSNTFTAKKSQNSGTSFEGEIVIRLLTDIQPSAGFALLIRAHAPSQELSNGTKDVSWKPADKIKKQDEEYLNYYKPREGRCVGRKWEKYNGKYELAQERLGIGIKAKTLSNWITLQ